MFMKPACSLALISSPNWCQSRLGLLTIYLPLPAVDGGRRSGVFRSMPSQAVADSSSGTMTLCAVPSISMQRQVEGRRGIVSGPVNVS
jgi:hypothetical protein